MLQRIQEFQFKISFPFFFFFCRIRNDFFRLLICNHFKFHIQWMWTFCWWYPRRGFSKPCEQKKFNQTRRRSQQCLVLYTPLWLTQISNTVSELPLPKWQLPLPCSLPPPPPWQRNTMQICISIICLNEILLQMYFLVDIYIRKLALNISWLCFMLLYFSNALANL